MKWGPVAGSAPPGGEKPLWKLLCDQTLGSPEPGALQPAGVVVPCPLPQRGSELASPQEVPSPAPAPRPAAQAHGPPELELRGELLLGPHPLQARAAEPKSGLAWGKAGVCAQLLAHPAAERPPPRSAVGKGAEDSQQQQGRGWSAEDQDPWLSWRGSRPPAPPPQPPARQSWKCHMAPGRAHERVQAVLPGAPRGPWHLVIERPKVQETKCIFLWTHKRAVLCGGGRER